MPCVSQPFVQVGEMKPQELTQRRTLPATSERKKVSSGLRFADFRQRGAEGGVAARSAKARLDEWEPLMRRHRRQPFLDHLGTVVPNY